MLAYIYTYIHTQEAVDGRVMMRHLHTPMPTLDPTCVQTHTHTSQGASFIALPGALSLHTHTHTHTHTISVI